jgi:exodeoxyribonuclease VII small subunit
MNTTKTEDKFETSFTRLEQILEKMNGGSVPLDEALQLYEEADKLIVNSHRRLTEAEQKIEVLIKNRNGELLLNQDQTPTTEPFSEQQG